MYFCFGLVRGSPGEVGRAQPRGHRPPAQRVTKPKPSGREEPASPDTGPGPSPRGELGRSHVSLPSLPPSARVLSPWPWGLLPGTFWTWSLPLTGGQRRTWSEGREWPVRPAPPTRLWVHVGRWPPRPPPVLSHGPDPARAPALLAAELRAAPSFLPPRQAHFSPGNVPAEAGAEAGAVPPRPGGATSFPAGLRPRRGHQPRVASAAAGPLSLRRPPRDAPTLGRGCRHVDSFQRARESPGPPKTSKTHTGAPPLPCPPRQTSPSEHLLLRCAPATGEAGGKYVGMAGAVGQAGGSGTGAHNGQRQPAKGRHPPLREPELDVGAPSSCSLMKEGTCSRSLVGGLRLRGCHSHTR